MQEKMLKKIKFLATDEGHTTADIEVDTLILYTDPRGLMLHPGINSAVARYCPLWAPLSACTVLFLGAHEQLPSESPILGLL
ncbi:hypothetical protein L3X38_012646 [Prunus dulcis]|uniref:Uncharacterized protein n=1 Tax=Prunus dulcis TaxID=3755 RepID=A0AAD4ZG92_PRUDU|nr:hypothetical protein L3X38_012646 [Prunus dulcis]